jgi:hypothetical protein
VGAGRNRLQLIQQLGHLIDARDDDRHARLVILYAEGTAEDSFGEGSAFATALEPHASVVTRLSAVQAGSLASFLASAPDSSPDA